MDEKLKSHPRYKLIEIFDKNSEFVGGKLDRNIRENRMGVFSLQFFDRDGRRIYPDSVSVKQTRHEFKFGCSLFLLDQFPEPEKNRFNRKVSTRMNRRGFSPRMSILKGTRARRDVR